MSDLNATASDEELVALATSASDTASDALEILFERYYDRVSLWCLRVAGDVDRASDMAQEVFLRLQKHLGSFEGRSKFSSWLYTMTRRTAINYSIGSARKQADQLDEENYASKAAADVDVEGDAAASETRALLREAVQRELSADESKVLYLRYVLGMTLPEIGRLMNLSNRSGAKAYVVSATRKLRRSLGESTLEGVQS